MIDKSVALLALTAITLSNQVPEVLEESTVFRNVFGKDKRMVIREFIQLKKKEEEAFWHVYEVYEQNLRKLHIKRVDILKEYQPAATVEALVNASNEFLKWTDKYFTFFNRYFKKFRQVIGRRKTIALFRLQITIQTIYSKPVETINSTSINIS